MRIGIVGLGRMGLSLARALVASGTEVHGYDRSTEAAELARAADVAVHGSLGELAGAVDVVVTSLPTVAAVRETATALAGVLRPGSLVVETSTCDPALAIELSALLDRSGVRFVDAPVSRKAPAMTMLIGGTADVLGAAAEPLGSVARSLVYVGELGGGYRVKLLQQYLKYARFLVASEALAFAGRIGLDLPAVIEGLGSGTGAEAGLATAEEFFEGDVAAIAAHAPTATIVKDIELAARMFADAGFASPGFQALREFFLAAGATELVDRPYPEVAQLLEGFRFPEMEDD
jgi:3-hydroxyisobutyrate dehydrogenase-like beta-hydroxyacid dehydrogenase